MRLMHERRKVIDKMRVEMGFSSAQRLLHTLKYEHTIVMRELSQMICSYWETRA